MSDHRGFSMIELMTVFVLIGIVLAVGAPSITRFRRSLEQEQARVQLMEDLRGARQKAVTQHVPMVVVFGDGVATSNLTTYKVHTDLNADGKVQTGELVVNRTLPKFSKISTISLQPVDSLFFDISGILRPGTSGGTIVLQTNTRLDTVRVSMAGMVYQP